MVLPDGRLASGSNDGTIRLWDTGNGTETAPIKPSADWIMALAVLPDSRLAFGSNGTIQLLNTRSGAETALLEGHDGWVTALAVLPDGRLASGGEDRTIRPWDPGNGQELSRFEVEADVRRLLSIPDGRLIAGDGLGRLHWLEVLG